MMLKKWLYSILDSFINILFKPFFVFISYLKSKESFAFWVVIIVNLITRLIVIDVADLSLNETVAIDEANNNVFGFSQNEIGYSVFEPVYKLILFIWVKLTAFSIYGMRSISAIAISIAAGLLFKGIRKVVDFRAACWVSLFYLISNIFIFHSQNMGSSSLAILLVIISSFNFLELLRNPSVKGAVVSGLINLILFFISNAFVSVSIIQLLLSFFFLRRNIKIAVIPFIVFLIGTNYPLVRYFSSNAILSNQLNIGLYWKNVEKLFYLNFVDYFFFYLAVFFTIVMVLNIYIKKLNKPAPLNARLLYRCFFIMFIIALVFILKSEKFLHFGMEIPSLSLFALSLSVILGFIFGLQHFNSRINLLAYISILLIFLPSLQLGANKQWPSKAIVKYINNHQGSSTQFLCDSYLPFLFYLSPEDFKNGAHREAGYKFRNLSSVKNISADRIIEQVRNTDTVIYVGHKNNYAINDSAIIRAGFNLNREARGNFEIIRFYKNRN